MTAALTGVAISSFESVVAMVAAGRMTGLATKIENDLHTYDQAAGAKLEQLREALDKGEASHPVVKATVAALEGVAGALGFTLPPEDQVFAHLRAAIDELFEAVDPVSSDATKTA